MNKLGVVSFILATASLSMVGCASTQSPEAAQSIQHGEVIEHSVAQSSSAEVDTQSGVAVQADPTLQQAEPIQVSPVGDVPESTQPAQ